MKCKTLLLLALSIVVGFPAGVVNAIDEEGNKLYLHEFSLPFFDRHPGKFHIADFDGDEDIEFLSVGTGQMGSAIYDFTYDAIFSRMIADIRYSNWVFNIIPIEADTIPAIECAVLLRDIDGDSMWVEIRSWAAGAKLCQTEAITGENIRDLKAAEWSGALWDGSIDTCIALELDGDPETELLVHSSVGYDCYPRGIFVYDYPSGKLKWKFLSGGNLGNFYITDIDNDGLDEIFCKSFVTGNGCNEINGIGDRSSTVLLIDHDGTVIWSDDLNDNFKVHASKLLAGDYDGNGSLELYYSRIQTLGNEDEFEDHIRILEKHRASDGKLLMHRTFDPEESFNQLMLADLDLDSIKELIVCDSISVWNAANLRKMKSAGLRYYSVKTVADISPVPDGYPEIIAFYQDTLAILDHDLNVIMKKSLGEKRKIIRTESFFTPFNQSCIAVLTSKETDVSAERVYKLHIFEVSNTPPPVPDITDVVRSFSWPVVLGVFGLGIILGILIIQSGKWLPKTKKKNTGHLEYDKLLTVINTFDHGQMAGKNLNRIALLFGNYPDDEESARKLMPRLQSASESYHSYSKGQLENLIIHARPFSEFRTDLETLEAAKKQLDSMVDPEKAESIFRHAIPESIEKIKTGIRSIRRKIHAHFACDVLQALLAVLNASKGNLQEHGVKLEDFRTCGDIRQKVLFAQEDLEAVIEELINNACSAMKEADSKSLKMELEFHDNRVIFRLKDSGHGIPVENPDKIFERGYSTKSKDGGYGLWYIRQAASKFGAQIKIQNREHAPGAMVSMTLKVVDDE